MTTDTSFLNSLGNYKECLNDATVSVQLEPNLIKAIKKGGCCSQNSSNHFAVVSSRELYGLRQLTVPRVSTITGP